MWTTPCREASRFLAESLIFPSFLRMATLISGSTFEATLKKLNGAALTTWVSGFWVVIQAIGRGMMLPVKNLYICFVLSSLVLKCCICSLLSFKDIGFDCLSLWFQKIRESERFPEFFQRFVKCEAWIIGRYFDAQSARFA
ncbi:hypothetical protein SDC9_124659 [bioreactor metagenome]|uniref:Uncharacterized protein n=1 Tax=bioreactor metagenome TaxID=1076179 RepID=A0A645CL16_9ZZZZ